VAKNAHVFCRRVLVHFILITILINTSSYESIFAMNKIGIKTKNILDAQKSQALSDVTGDQGKIKISVLEERIKAYARSHPKEIASLVDKWLSEDL
jgi:flagellar biosynthesis/type III secretory pathway M-ring protein FliF/YscJ